MEIKTMQVVLRHLVPSEGKVIKNTVTEEYYPEGIYLGKEENAENYIEVGSSEAAEFDIE
ncbi:MAG: hypothetical protein IJ725_05390 [Ruminococcus sp.]|nr:hypothetical protein [Ruminococcus sp.]